MRALESPNSRSVHGESDWKSGRLVRRMSHTDGYSRFHQSLYLIRQKDIEITNEMGDFLKFAEHYFSVIDRYFKYL